MCRLLWTMSIGRCSMWQIDTLSTPWIGWWATLVFREIWNRTNCQNTYFKWTKQQFIKSIHLPPIPKGKTVKVCFYIAQYPVRWTAQSAFTLFALTSRHVHSDTNSASPGSILSRSHLHELLRLTTNASSCCTLMIPTDTSYGCRPTTAAMDSSYGRSGPRRRMLCSACSWSNPGNCRLVCGRMSRCHDGR